MGSGVSCTDAHLTRTIVVVTASIQTGLAVEHVVDVLRSVGLGGGRKRWMHAGEIRLLLLLLEVWVLVGNMSARCSQGMTNTVLTDHCWALVTGPKAHVHVLAKVDHVHIQALDILFRLLLVRVVARAQALHVD